VAWGKGKQKQKSTCAAARVKLEKQNKKSSYGNKRTFFLRFSWTPQPPGVSMPGGHGVPMLLLPNNVPMHKKQRRKG